MQFTIKKNMNGDWAITPNEGPFQGFVVATAEGVDMTLTAINHGKLVGTIKAVWGVQLDQALDIYSDTNTLRSLNLGKPFSFEADIPVELRANNLYDIPSGHIVARCKRLVMVGSTLLRRRT